MHTDHRSLHNFIIHTDNQSLPNLPAEDRLETHHFTPNIEVARQVRGMGAGADGLGAAGGQGGRCCGSTMCRHDHGIHSQGVCGRTDVTHACHASRAHLVVTDSQCIKRMFGPGHLGGRTSVCDVHFSRPCALEKSVTFTEGRGARPSTFFEGARPREICYIYRGSGGAPIYFF